MDVFLKCIDDKDLLLALWDLTSLSDRLQMKNQVLWKLCIAAAGEIYAVQTILFTRALGWLHSN